MYPFLQPIKASTKESASWNCSVKAMAFKDLASSRWNIHQGSFYALVFIFSGKQYGSYIVNKKQIQGVCPLASVADDL